MLRNRLSTQSDEAPWVRAKTLHDCFLYWLPVSTFPSRHAERAWLNGFLALFTASLEGSPGLRCETFLQLSVVSEHLGTSFLRQAQGMPKVTGLARVPGQRMVEPPTPEELQEASKSGKPLSLKNIAAGYVKWIHTGDHQRLRDLFAGYGGLISLFVPPDPRTTPPTLEITPRMRRAMPVFERQDVDGLIRSTFAMRAGWLPKSKQLFGEGLEDRPEFPGVPFVLPLPAAEHILQATPEWRTSLFDLFPVMVRESEVDLGVLLLFRDPAFESLFQQVLQTMQEQGHVYPGVQRHEEPQEGARA